MNRASFALLTAIALLCSSGCEIGDRIFGFNRSNCNSCTTACGDGACGNGSCSPGNCNCNLASSGGAAASDPSAVDPSANGSYANGSNANGSNANGSNANGCGPNGAGPNGNGPNGYGYGHGPVPRGVGGTYVGPEGPPTGAVAYPYYTNRGPRDYLDPNPPSIGP